MKKANLSQVAAELNATRLQPELPIGPPPVPRKATTGATARKAGPRGGATTVTPGGLYRTTAYFTAEERRALRRMAQDQERPYAEIIREAVRRYLGMS